MSEPAASEKHPGDLLLQMLLHEAVSRLGGTMEIDLVDLRGGAVNVLGNETRIKCVVIGMGNA